MICFTNQLVKNLNQLKHFLAHFIILGYSFLQYLYLKCLKIKIIFFSLLCYSLVFSMGFQSFFTTFLYELGMQKHIGSVEALLSSGITLFWRGRWYLFSIYRRQGYKSVLDARYKTQKNVSTNLLEQFLSDEISKVIVTNLYINLKVKRCHWKLKICSLLYSVPAMHPVDFIYSVCTVKYCI